MDQRSMDTLFVISRFSRAKTALDTASPLIDRRSKVGSPRQQAKSIGAPVWFGGAPFDPVTFEQEDGL